MARQQQKTTTMVPPHPGEVNPEGIRRALETEQDKINAALAHAVTDSRGNPAEGYTPPPPPPPRNAGNKRKTKVEEEQESQNDADFPEVEEISAADCYASSLKNADKSIGQYISAINGKIKRETEAGGFSTVVKFRVTPNDWVNVRHIIDFYKSRGFVIEDYETNHPQVGPNAGTIEYTFTISWAEAR
jgi:hypothetical protein